MPCFFCQRNIQEIDFKNTSLLERFLSLSAKIKKRTKTGLCSFHQRRLKRAVKRARYLGLLPYVSE